MPYVGGKYEKPARNRVKPPSPLPLSRRRYSRAPKRKISIRLNPIMLLGGALLLLGLVKLLTM